MKKFILTFFLLFYYSLFAQSPFPDSVIAVNFGPGAGFGQNYFPQNILGFPDSSAAWNFPSANPAEILTLGSGGSITLQFTDNEIYDGPGPDFTIFENVFEFSPGNFYRETAIVEVSTDGNLWTQFPFDDSSGIGLAGRTPTNGSANPQDPALSGGDSFDLADVQISVIRYIRITDADSLFADSGPSFDLDAVVGINSRPQITDIPDTEIPVQNSFRIVASFPNPFNGSTRLLIDAQKPIRTEIYIFNILGQNITQLQKYLTLTPGQNRVSLHFDSSLPAGQYFVKLSGLKKMHSILYLP